MLIDNINWLGIKRSTLTQIEVQTVSNGVITVSCGSKQAAMHRYNGSFDSDNFWRFMHLKPVGGPISINIGNVLQSYRTNNTITILFKDGTSKVLTFVSTPKAEINNDYIVTNFNNYWAIWDIDSFEGNYLTVVTVNPGESIQTAINNASPGALIKLANGTHTITSTLEFRPEIDLYGTKLCTLRNSTTGHVGLMRGDQPTGTFNFYGLATFERKSPALVTESIFMVHKVGQKLNICGYSAMNEDGALGFYQGSNPYAGTSGGFMRVKLYQCDSEGSMFDGDQFQDGFDIDVRICNCGSATYFPDPDPGNANCQFIHRGGYIYKTTPSGGYVCEDYGTYVHWDLFTCIFNMQGNYFYSGFSSGQHLYEFADCMVVTSQSSWTGFGGPTEIYVNDGFLITPVADANVTKTGEGDYDVIQYLAVSPGTLKLPLINSGEINDVNIVIAGSDVNESVYVWEVLKDTDGTLTNQNIDWIPSATLEIGLEYVYTQYINLSIKPIVCYSYSGINSQISRAYHYYPDVMCVLPFYAGLGTYPGSVSTISLGNMRAMVNVTAGDPAIGTDWEYNANLEFLEEGGGLYVNGTTGALVKDEIWTNITQASPQYIRLYSTTGLPYMVSAGQQIHLYDVVGFSNPPTGRFRINSVVNNAWPNNYIEVEHNLGTGSFVSGKGKVHFLSGATAVCTAKLNAVRKGRDQSWWDARYSAQQANAPWVSQFGWGSINIINAIAYAGTVISDPHLSLSTPTISKFYNVAAIDEWGNPYRNVGVRAYIDRTAGGVAKMSFYQVQDGSGSLTLITSNYDGSGTIYFTLYDNDTGPRLFQATHFKRNGTSVTSSFGFANAQPIIQTITNAITHKVSSPLRRLLNNINKKGPSS